MLDYTVTLAPTETELDAATDTLSFSFTETPDLLLLDKDALRERARRADVVDPYALRRYWRVARLDATFADPPFNRVNDLMTTLATYDGVAAVERTSDEQLTLEVEARKARELVKRVEVYFQGLHVYRLSTTKVIVEPFALLNKFSHCWSP